MDGAPPATTCDHPSAGAWDGDAEAGAGAVARSARARMSAVTDYSTIPGAAAGCSWRASLMRAAARVSTTTGGVGGACLRELRQSRTTVVGRRRLATS